MGFLEDSGFSWETQEAGGLIPGLKEAVPVFEVLELRLLEQGVNERGQGRTLRKNHQSAEQQHDYDDGKKPKLLTLTQEHPYLF